ncbi:MAG: hypothetical protein GQ570_09220 [Helicobacteraceae bacterium]|nr:hypothetical protein [Helicobacteraceae bacterium]
MGYDTSIAGTDSNGDNKTTDSGGIWDVDDTGNGSGDDDPNQENFTWPTTEGAEGDYKVYIKNYGGAVSEDTDVDINFISNGILTTQTVTIPAGSESIGAYSFEHKEPSIINVPTDERENYGRLTLTRVGASDIQVSGSGAATGLTAHMQTNAMEESINLRDIAGALSADQASAMGFNTNVNTIAAVDANNVGAGVTTLQGAMSVMSIADSAREGLDKIRASLGTAQAQFISTINNISVTSVNVQAAESQLRNIDFATESAKFSKQNIIAQAGSYALTQANTKQQAVLQLLQ